MTRQDIANMVGITTETAIRIMSRLKRDRLMSGTPKRLVILDLPRPNKFASLWPSTASPSGVQTPAQRMSQS